MRDRENGRRRERKRLVYGGGDDDDLDHIEISTFPMVSFTDELW